MIWSQKNFLVKNDRGGYRHLYFKLGCHVLVSIRSCNAPSIYYHRWYTQTNRASRAILIRNHWSHEIFWHTWCAKCLFVYVLTPVWHTKKNSRESPTPRKRGSLLSSGKYLPPLFILICRYMYAKNNRSRNTKKITNCSPRIISLSLPPSALLQFKWCTAWSVNRHVIQIR